MKGVTILQFALQNFPRRAQLEFTFRFAVLRLGRWPEAMARSSDPKLRASLHFGPCKQRDQLAHRLRSGDLQNQRGNCNPDQGRDAQ